MSLDRTLKCKSALIRLRNVLTRAERIEMLKDNETWQEGQSVFGLPKVALRRRKAKAKAKAEPGAATGTDQAATDSGASVEKES